MLCFCQVVVLFIFVYFFRETIQTNTNLMMSSLIHHHIDCKKKKNSTMGFLHIPSNCMCHKTQTFLKQKFRLAGQGKVTGIKIFLISRMFFLEGFKMEHDHCFFEIILTYHHLDTYKGGAETSASHHTICQ